MGEKTAIAWCDHTFNAWEGCEKAGPACAHCYAETRAKRFGHSRGGKHMPLWGPGSARLGRSEAYWRKPLKWHRDALRDGVRRKVFCLSLGDIFDDHPDTAGHRARLWPLIEECTALDWLLLTKRPQNADCLVPESWRDGWPSHVWAGVSAGTQDKLDERIPLLLRVPAAVRFVSAEPLLGRVVLRERYTLGTFLHCDADGDDENGRSCEGCEGNPWPEGSDCAAVRGPRLDWLVIGGESGPGARPCDVAWIRSLVRQCRDAEVACFVKQLGSNYCDELNGIGGALTKQPDTIPPIKRLRDRAGADPDEWPEDLRVRMWPGESWR